MSAAALAPNRRLLGMSLGHGSDWSQCFAYEPQINPGREAVL